MWSLYNDGKFLEPLVFSNGKSQEDVVQEVAEAIEQGHKIIFIKGVCGTGKSSVALNLAKELGKASVVVPIKTLQQQYEDDYSNKMYLIKDGKRLRIQVLTGRNNHECPFIENIKPDEDTEYGGKQTKLFDAESSEDTSKQKNRETDRSCDNPFLPCKIDIKEKNMSRIKRFIMLNPAVNVQDFGTIHDVKRRSIAPACPYWSPILPAEFDINIPDSKPVVYKGLCGVDYKFHRRKSGCGYYDQFQAYVDADVMVFNSQKYKLETAMNRKPETDIDVIDECDEFLDSLSNQRTLNLNRLQLALSSLFFYDQKTMELNSEMVNAIGEAIKSPETRKLIESQEVIKLGSSFILRILKYFLESSKLIEAFEDDELNYCNACYETARIFENFLDETYISFQSEEKEQFSGKKEEEITVKVVTINLEKRLKEFLDKSRVLVMMSGTLHSEDVLKKVFGIHDFKIIEAESKSQGKVDRIRTGLERNFRYSQLKQGRLTRKQYLDALSECIEKAKPPVLVHVNSFSDLPSEEEKQEHNIKNLMAREELKQLQKKYKMAELVDEFKQGKTQVLFSTKCRRGMDFPGETCNTIILTKYPYPDTSSLFWRVLNKEHPHLFWGFYRDKARREFLQKIYRGLRSKHDHIYLLSPDIRALAEVVL